MIQPNKTLHEEFCELEKSGKPLEDWPEHVLEALAAIGWERLSIPLQ
jgi:hypothetical protein